MPLRKRWRSGTALLVLAGLAAVALAGSRRGRGDILAAAVLALVLCAALELAILILIAPSTPGRSVRALLAYGQIRFRHSAELSLVGAGGCGARPAAPVPRAGLNLHLGATCALCCPRLLSAVSTPAWLSGCARLRTATARDLVAIGALAFVLRAAWAFVYGRVEAGPLDARFFEVTASHLAGGGGYTQLFGAATAHAPPASLSSSRSRYRVLGIHVKLGLALNVVLATATAMLLYLVAREAMGRTAGRVAGVTFAILPAPIFFTGLFLSETTFMFMLVGFLALAVFLPDRRWTPVALGVAAGMARSPRARARCCR